MITKNRMKKMIIITLLMITLFSIGSNCFAIDIGVKNIEVISQYDNLMTYNGNKLILFFTGYKEGDTTYPAYCINKDLPGAGKGEYYVTGNSKIDNINVWRAIINGYPYKTLEELGAQERREAYTATNYAVYTIQYNIDPSEFAPVDSDAGRRTYQIYLNIVNAAKNSTEEMVNELTLNIDKISSNWEIDLMNKECVSKTYKILSNCNDGKCEIYTRGIVPNGTIVTDSSNNIKNTFKVGEEFKILIPIQNLLQSESFTIEAKAKMKTKPVIHGIPQVSIFQDYAIAGYLEEEIDTSFVEDYQKNSTSLWIIKKEYDTETRLSGVKFNLLDENKNVVLENLITNEEGEIKLEGMMPGKYFLQEIETLDGYNLYTDYIEINLKMNEEFEVIVNNTLKEVSIVEKNTEIKEVIPNYTETVITTTNTSTLENYNVEKKIDNKVIKKLPVTGY